MKKRIWFNRWFSTGIHFIDKIREGDINKEFEIFVTHHNQNREYIKRADHFSIEKVMEEKEYIEFCIGYCKENKIDIFIPKFKLSEISRNRSKFEEIGVKVLLAAEDSIIELVKNKSDFYEECRKHSIVEIPEYYRVESEEEFKRAYQEMKSKNKIVCYKPEVSEGGLDFRVIYEDKKDEKYGDNLISYERAKVKFADKKGSGKIMVMEYLDGPEYSIDCLANNGKILAAIPRKKEGWDRVLENREELINVAEKMAEIYNFSYVFNVQVKYSNGIPKLLEVNPRMSGGLHVSCMSGINFPYLAVKVLNKEKVEIPVPKFGIVQNTMKVSGKVRGKG